MDCHRCGGTLTIYELGGSESWVCQACGWVGVETEHGSEPSERESWDDALKRFYEKHRPAAEEAAESSPGTDPGAAVAELDLPGDGDVVERRRRAITDLYEYLRKHGTARRSDFLELVDASAVEYATPEAFWTNAGRDGLRELPGVVAPGAGENVWQYVDANA